MRSCAFTVELLIHAVHEVMLEIAGSELEAADAVHMLSAVSKLPKAGPVPPLVRNM